MPVAPVVVLRICLLLPVAGIARGPTLIGARVLRMEGKLGCFRPGAFADLLVIDGNPLKDLGLFQASDKSLVAIMKGGRFHRNRLR